MKRFQFIIVYCLLTILLCSPAFGQGGVVPPFTTIFIRTVLDDATAAAARTTLGLGTGDSPTFVTLNVYQLTADEVKLEGSLDILLLNTGDALLYEAGGNILLEVFGYENSILYVDSNGFIKMDTKLLWNTATSIFSVNGTSKFGDAGKTDYVNITSDGVQTFHGNARWWQGVVLDTSRFKEPPVNSATLVNRGIGTAYEYTKDQEAEHVHIQVSIPGFWDVGEDLQAILLWDTPVTSDVCDWEIHYQFRAEDGVMDSVIYDGVANSVAAESSHVSKGLVHSTVTIPTAAFDTGDKMLRLGVYRDGVTDSIDNFVYLHGIRLRGVRYKTGGAM